MHNITAEDIQKAVDSWDMLLRPQAVYCNPSVAETIEKELGDRYLIVPSPLVKENQIIMIDRRKLKEWTYGKI